MNSQAWVDLVLPSQGLRCVAVPQQAPKTGFRHYFLNDNSQASATIAKLDDQGENVFYALAGFTDDARDRERDAKGRLVRGGRKQANVGWLRSFFSDIDCGEDKPYATARDGLVALKTFLDLTGLPKPYIVSSGRGLHIYWPMDDDVERVDWKATAVQLKQAMVIAGFHADPSRTSDEASVLRPVGAHHRKAQAIPVRLLKDGEIWSHEDFRAQVGAFLAANHAVPETVKGPKLNADLMGGLEYPPTYADKIADRCAVARLVRDTQGNVDQPTWYRVLGLVAFCEDADQVAQEWSCGHPAYDPDEVATKLEQQRAFKPTTCAKLGECQPDLCKACPHFGKLASPIRLGMEAPEIPIVAQPAPQPQTMGFITTGAAAPPPANAPRAIILPPGWRYAAFNGVACIQQAVTDDDGVTSWNPFSDTLFYPVSRLNIDDGFAMEVEMYVRADAAGNPTQTRRFTVPCATVSSGGKELAAALGRYEIAPRHPSQKPIMDAYLAAWMTKLKNEADEIRQFQHFGWHDDKFLVGNTLIEPGGTQRSVLLKGIASVKAPALGPKGSLDVWKDAIHRAYHHQGQEHFQFLVALGFAAPLWPLFAQYGGITVFAHSEGSGVGKTTAQRAALSAWGRWEDLQLADQKITQNMLWGLMGAYHNLPVLYDELTNQSAAAASDLVFSASSGRQKDRMMPDGNMRTNNNNWSTILMASGNNLLSEKMANNRANAEAELVRTFEFTCPQNSPLSVNEAQAIFPLLVDNYGHAGILFASYVVERKDTIAKMLTQVQQIVNTEAGMRQSERYWSALFACVTTAVAICNKLDLLRFDAKGLKSWMYDRLTDNRQQRDQSVNQPLEQFGRMLADMWSGILITIGEGDLRSGVPALIPDGVSPPRFGQLTGRVILPAEKDRKVKPPVLLLNAASVREWTGKQKVSAREMFNALVAAGWASPAVTKFTLGKGTTQFGSTSSQVTCWSVDLSKVAAQSGHTGIADRFTAINGGLTGDQVDGAKTTARA